MRDKVIQRYGLLWFIGLVLTSCTLSYHAPTGGVVVVTWPDAPQATPTNTWQAATYTPTPAVTLETNTPRPTWTPASTEATPTQEISTPLPPSVTPSVFPTQAIPTFTPTPVQQVCIGIVNANPGLNLRSAPQIGPNVITTIPNGAEIEVYPQASEGAGNWWNVFWVQEFVAGWVSRDFVVVQGCTVDIP